MADTVLQPGTEVRDSVQGLGERVAHLLVEIDAPCAAQGDDRNSIGYSCRQNIGVHHSS